ncbi:MAG: NrfD/PsrC family molybdoenzyme membrane anchor subunit [Polyangiaceae bacterium]
MAALLLGNPTARELTDQLLAPVLHPPRWIRPAMWIFGTATLLLWVLIGYTLVTGIGVWGNNVPNAWAFAITNFVWWIGIGHAGTFISAFLLLLGQKWRTSINRFAEGMTLFAIVQAGLFPLLHMGRAWFFYWLVPYPSTMRVWPQFRSSLTWDVAAVTTYLTVSILFWYLGLVPDLAIVRDRASSIWRRRIYGIFALGWDGSTRTWARFRIAYGLLAGIAAPLVVSVHSIVSMDFAIAILPGWHSPIFPPYFVAGAIFSGFALVLTLMIPARALYGLENVVTEKHLDNMGKLLLTTGLVVTYAYIFESYTARISGDRFESFIYLIGRPHGPYALAFWTVIFCNCVAPQAMWSKKCRTTPWILWMVALFVQIGMWLERYMLIVSSLSRDRLPSSWHEYRPSLVDAGILAGTICFFLFLFLCFLRWVPFIPIAELKQLAREKASSPEAAT